MIFARLIILLSRMVVGRILCFTSWWCVSGLHVQKVHPLSSVILTVPTDHISLVCVPVGDLILLPKPTLLSRCVRVGNNAAAPASTCVEGGEIALAKGYSLAVESDLERRSVRNTAYSRGYFFPAIVRPAGYAREYSLVPSCLLRVGMEKLCRLESVERMSHRVK